MASKLANILDKASDVAQAIPTIAENGQTCLEKVGMEARYAHLLRNEWRRESEYTRPLVLSEYQIQTEFKVSEDEDIAKMQAESAQVREDERKVRAYKKMQKKAAKRAKKEAEKQKPKEQRKEPLESTYEVITYEETEQKPTTWKDFAGGTPYDPSYWQN